MDQDYPNVETILIDNGSKDKSPDIIKSLDRDFDSVRSFCLSENLGNCRAFNLGLSKASGDFLIDLSADDVLLPDRIMEGILSFEHSGDAYGVNFTDAAYINEKGETTGFHYKRDKSGRLTSRIPTGNVYDELLARYFICTPTMMMRSSLMEQLGGYDEDLSYEDFDFWIRSGKITKYCFTDKVLVKKRVLKDSLSSGQYRRNSRILESTYRVCLKAEAINETDSDRKALIRRCRYELRKAVLSHNLHVAFKFSEMLKRNTRQGIERIIYTLTYRILKIWS